MLLQNQVVGTQCGLKFIDDVWVTYIVLQDEVEEAQVTCTGG